jgi:hypothetical protein
MQERSFCPTLNQSGCGLHGRLQPSKYHQIPLKEQDQIKTSFITPFGAFCYTTMPFGLKSVGATYQRVYNGVCILNSGTMLKRTLTTWS